MWGSFAGPVLDGGKEPAYRYFYTLPLLHYQSEGRLRETVAAVLARPPSLIVDECRIESRPDPCLADVDSEDLRGLLAGYDRSEVGRFTLYVRRND